MGQFQVSGFKFQVFNLPGARLIFLVFLVPNRNLNPNRSIAKWIKIPMTLEIRIRPVFSRTRQGGGFC
jgi:hypothetical protein